MKHAAVIHNWRGGVLSRAGSSDPVDLNHPDHVAALRRIANRYDVIITQGWDFNAQVRDRLRAYAQQEGRSISFLRYLGGIAFRWWDQAGEMTIVPVQRAVTGDGRVLNRQWVLTTSTGAPIRAALENGRSHLMNLGSPSLRAAAVEHCRRLASGWDGIFIDECTPDYSGFQLNPGEVDPWYPPTRDQYEWSRRDLIREVTAGLATDGKAVGANLVPTHTQHGFFPTTVTRENPGLTHPFIEVFATGWDSRLTVQGRSGIATTFASMSWLENAAQLGRTAIANVYSNEPQTLRYGLSLFLAAAGPNCAFAGHRPVANDEYTIEPTWLPEYDLVEDLGRPLGKATGVNVVARWFERGATVANTLPTASTAQLDGYCRGINESADTVERTIPPSCGEILVGKRFDTYRPTVSDPSAPYMLINGTWRRPEPQPKNPTQWAVNASFAEGTNGWVAGRGGTLSTRGSGGPDNLPYAELSVPAGATDAFVINSRQQACPPGRTVNLSLWAKGPSQILLLAADFYDANDRYLSFGYGEVCVSEVWTRVGRGITPPPGAAGMRVFLQKRGTASRPETIALTGWQLEGGHDGQFAPYRA